MQRVELIKAVRLFEDDRRIDGGKFLPLELPIRPVVIQGSNGTLMRPGMHEESVITFAGNVGSPAFPAEFVDGQVWAIDAFGVLNGGAAAKMVSGQIILAVGDVIQCDLTNLDLTNLFSESFISNDIYIDAQVNAQVLNGAAADAATIHARRVA